MYTHFLILLLFPGPGLPADNRLLKDGKCVTVAASRPLPDELRACGNWTNRSLDQVPLRHRALQGVNLTGTRVSRTRVEQGSFDQARLGDADWWSLEVSDVTFYGADLRGARWFQVRCSRCDFTGADARAARFEEVRLTRADFRGARLEGAFFERSLLRDCDFRGANLMDSHWGSTRCERCLADSASRLPWSPGEARSRGFRFE